MLSKIKNKIHEWNASRELYKYASILAKDSYGLNAEQLVDLIYGEKWQRFFWIKQVHSEILALAKLIEQQKPKFLLEIGTANGGSLFLFTKLAHLEATIISIDLPDGKYGGGYSAYKESFYKSFSLSNQNMILYRADSHNEKTVKQIQNLLTGNELDFLFIDGDHTYEGVKKDFELYSPMVKSPGIIGFHDIAQHPPEWNVGVDEFFNEIKNLYKHQIFIDNPQQGWAGIGIIHK